MESITQKLVDFVTESNFSRLPKDVVHETKRILLDSFGCALAGLSTDKGRFSIRLAKKLGGSPESTIIGLGDKVSSVNAAFANGELINALDMDPILYPAHVSPYVIPSALAIAESRKASGRDLILSVALGHEISYRLGRSLAWQRRYDKQSREFVETDVHGYSPCIFGGAAAVGKILQFNQEKMAYLMGVAGHFSPIETMVKWIKSPPSPMTKYLCAGWLSQAQVTASLLVEIGYTGDTTVLDGEYGFWKSIASLKWKPEILLEKLGEEWHLSLTEYKPYPCCRFMHGALDSFIKIIEENGLKPNDIDSVKIELDPLVDRPIWQNQELRSQIDTQFSVPYVFAAAVHRFKSSYEWGSPQNFNKPEIKEFMSKVKFGPHPDFEKVLVSSGGKLSSVEVNALGKTFKEEKTWAKGDPSPKEAFMDNHELTKKFIDNASYFLSKEKIQKAIELIFELEKLEEISPVLQNLSL